MKIVKFSIASLLIANHLYFAIFNGWLYEFLWLGIFQELILFDWIVY